MKKLKIAW